MNIYNPKFREARAKCEDWRTYRILQMLDEDEEEEIDEDDLPRTSEDVDIVLSWDKPKDS
ncbi:hypothetical protein ACFLZH_02545 [Patescibacteria group bacterium]